MYDNVNLENINNQHQPQNKFSPKNNLFSGTSGIQNKKKKKDLNNHGTSSSINSNKGPGSKVASKYH